MSLLQTWAHGGIVCRKDQEAAKRCENVLKQNPARPCMTKALALDGRMCHLETVSEVLADRNRTLTGIACPILPLKTFLTEAMPVY